MVNQDKITFEFATRDDCLDKMVPSDLREVVAERDHLRIENARLNSLLNNTDEADCNYDLAIMHVVDAGPEYGRRVRLTKKAESGGIGTEVVFEFSDANDLDDFIEQLENVKKDAWADG